MAVGAKLTIANQPALIQAAVGMMIVVGVVVRMCLIMRAVMAILRRATPTIILDKLHSH